MAKGIENRKTFRSSLNITATCQDCGWTCYTSNGLGLAAQHSDRYDHHVQWELERSGSYKREGNEDKK